MTATPKTEIPDDMNLLDYYAGLAMNGILANPKVDSTMISDVVLPAYNLAKAMLKERLKHL